MQQKNATLNNIHQSVTGGYGTETLTQKKLEWRSRIQRFSPAMVKEKNQVH